MSELPLKPGEKVDGVIPAIDVDPKTLEAGPVQLIPQDEMAYRLHEDGSKTQNPDVWKSVEVPQHIVEQMHEGLPPMVRRTARERYEALVQRLMETGRLTQSKFGYPVWPESVQRVLDGLGFKRDNTDLNAQVYALAKHYIVKAENQQRAKDARKVTNDWHGHFD